MNRIAADTARVAATVLICDDSLVLRELVRAVLEPGEYEIVEAEDGHQSLELARSRRPDLVLLDVMMPGQSGLGVLRQIRSDPAIAHLPVVMLSARAQAADREAALEAGADEYLVKPFGAVELELLVGGLLGKGDDASAPS